MAKKKPDEWKKEGDELKATFMAAKKKPQNFGMVVAKEGMILKTHPMQSSDKMYKEAKNSDGGTSKGIKGVLTVQGTQIEFKYEGTEKDLPGGFDTKFKQYLALVKVKGFKADFVPADAADEKKAAKKPEEEPKPEPKAKPKPEEAAADGKDEKEPASARADASKGEISKEQLTKNFRHITDIFKLSFKNMDEKDAEELKGALKNIGAAISSGDLNGAQNMMNKLELITGVGPNSPMQPVSLGSAKKKKDKLSPEDAKKRKKELTKDLADLKSDIKEAMLNAEKKDQSELQKLIKDFGKQMKSDKIEDADETFDEIRERVESLLEALENAEEEAPGLSPEREAERANQMDDLQKRVDALLASF